MGARTMAALALACVFAGIGAAALLQRLALRYRRARASRPPVRRRRRRKPRRERRVCGRRYGHCGHPFPFFCRLLGSCCLCGALVMPWLERRPRDSSPP